ncbi:MAG: 50S ribosomal protein L24 [Thermoplasmata archaeon]
MAKSRKPRKQRKRAYESPHHRRGRLLSAHLSPKYLEDTKVRYPRSLPIREGDTVVVMRGSQKGHEGKVARVDHRGIRVYVEGVTTTKADGTEVGKPIHPSNLMITKLDMTDPWRRKLIERAGGES